MATLCVEDYQRILLNNDKQIKNSVNLTCLLPILRTKGLLTDDEFRLLQEMQYDTRKNVQLVRILQSKGGGNALQLFIEALQEEGEHMGHKHLAVTLLGEISAIKPRPPAVAKKPPPPTLPRKTKGTHTQPQPFSSPQAVKKQPLLPHPVRKKSQSVTGLDEEPVY